MKVETPQILWHEECVRGGKSWAAALSGVSLVESGGSPCSSTTLLSAAAANRKPTLTPSYCLATAGNGSDVHLWRLSFAAASTMTTTTTAATVSSPPSNATAATTNGSSSSNSIPKDEPQQHNNNSGSSSSSITHGEYQHQQQQGAGNSIEPDVATTTTATANGGAIPPVPTAIGDPPSITPPTATNTVTSTNSTGTPPSNASSSLMTKIDFICALTRHDGAVNAVAFSPNGLHLATAGDAGCVIVWSVPPQPGNHNNNNSTTNNNSTNNSHATPGFLSSVATRVQKNDHWCHAVSKESDLAVQIAARTCDGVTDLSWSADSKRLVACTIDHTVLILENVNHPSGTSGATVAAAWEAVYRNPSLHSHLVQGVAYDPTNVYIASQSSDRTVRVLQRKLSSAAVGATISLASSQPKKAVMRPFNGCRSSDGNCNAVPSAEQAAIMAQILTDTKLEVSTKSKQVKFHCSSSNNTIVSGAATGLESASVVASGNDTNLHNDNKINTTNNNNNKQYWYATETTLKSFVRRLAWTVDGAYLITPAAIWSTPNDVMTCDGDLDGVAGAAAKDNPNPNQPPIESGRVGGSYATLMFQRHRFDEPWKVLGGLEKPSIAVCPNPMLFQLPPAFSPLGSPTDQDVVMNLEDSKENCSENSAASPSRLSPSIQQYSLPYRSIFAVLTWDSVLIYDTVHDQPLAVVRDIHYAHLVDATWTPDGRNLLVCSTDGYISILRFDAGELGEVYLPPPTTTTLENYSPPPLTSDAFNGASPVSGRSIADVKLPLVTTLAAPLPPCEPGPYTVHCPPAKRAKVRIAPTPVEASIMQSISTTNIDMSLTSADISASSTATDAMVSSETQKRTATDAELAVDKLSLTDSAASSTVQPTKKLKKRIQATLMPVS